MKGVRKKAELAPTVFHGQGPAESVVEVFQRLGGDGVNHLLVKSRIGLTGIEAVLDENRPLVQFDGPVKAI